MLIQIKDHQPTNYMIYWGFGMILSILIIKKRKILFIEKKKLWLCLKKLIKRYQIFQSHTKKTLMLCILVEYLRLTICQNLLIHPLLLRILMKKKIKVLYMYNILELLFLNY